MKFIYCFTNLINNKQYIGSSCSNDPQRRYAQHLYWVNHPEGEKGQYPLYCAIRKYGKDNFSYKILEILSDDISELDLHKIEEQYIINYNSLIPNGYNQTLDTNHPLNDPNTYKKMSNTKRELARQVAEIDDQNNIIHIWRSIADCAEETNYNEKHIASCCRGERKTTSGKRFCWLDESGLIIIPEYHRDPYKGAIGTTQIQSTSKKVAKLDENNKIIEIYPTIALAARENHCDASGISKTCNGKRLKCGGFKWRYINE